MNKYPECKKIGFQIITAGCLKPEIEVIAAYDVEKLIRDAPVVTGLMTNKSDGTVSYTDFEIVDKPYVTHTAKLLCIQPIKREPMRVEFEAGPYLYPINIEKHIRQFDGKKVRVTLEEIGE